MCLGLLLLIVGAYGILAWSAGSLIWPVDAYRHWQHREELAARFMSSIPFDTDTGGGFAGLPGTSIWAKVPQGVFGMVSDTSSDGKFGLRPAVWWHSKRTPHRNVVLTTLEAVRTSPHLAFVPESDGGRFWSGLRETAEDIVADAASSGDTKGAYSIELQSREGVRRRLDVDLECGIAIIFEWMSKDTEPLDMYEYFTIGEPVPAKN